MANCDAVGVTPFIKCDETNRQNVDTSQSSTFSSSDNSNAISSNFYRQFKLLKSTTSNQEGTLKDTIVLAEHDRTAVHCGQLNKQFESTLTI